MNSKMCELKLIICYEIQFAKYTAIKYDKNNTVDREHITIGLSFNIERNV